MRMKIVHREKGLKYLLIAIRYKFIFSLVQWENYDDEIIKRTVFTYKWYGKVKLGRLS